MTDWALKRFWTAAKAVTVDGGHAVELDGRPIRTPAKVMLVVPTKELAQALAAEWDAQTDQVNPETMPHTRMANSAIDKVVPQFDAVADMLAEYGGSDLICYRATHPDGLTAKQTANWDPWLAWSANALDAPLITTSGVMPVDQPAASLSNLRRTLGSYTPFQLAAVHDLVTITGSLVLGLAVAHGKLSADAAFDLSRIDEDWQIAEWGEDEEATALAARKRTDLLMAEQFLGMC